MLRLPVTNLSANQVVKEAELRDSNDVVDTDYEDEESNRKEAETVIKTFEPRVTPAVPTVATASKEKTEQNEVKQTHTIFMSRRSLWRILIAKR